MCHLFPPCCQHLPSSLRPHRLLQLLRLAGLQGLGQVPCMSLGYRGRDPHVGPPYSEDWKGPPDAGGRLSLTLSLASAEGGGAAPHPHSGRVRKAGQKQA